MQEFQSRVGIDRSLSSYRGYQKAYKHLERFIRKKYKIRDISLSRLDLPFIEAFDFYLRVECGLMPGSAITDIIYLQKAARIALNRNLIILIPNFPNLNVHKFRILLEVVRSFLK